MESATFSKNAIPVKFGLFIGFGMMFFTTLNGLYWIQNEKLYKAVGYIVNFIFPLTIGVFCARNQKLSNGGFLNHRETFRALFICILIATLINFIYSYLFAIYSWESYSKYKIESLKIMIIDFRDRILIYGIVNFIIAAIIKKNKPAETV
jgi:hypothetical protein